MAVRFDASTEFYSRTTGLGASSTATLTCWGKISTDRNASSGFWGLKDGNEWSMETDSDGLTCRLWRGGAWATTGRLLTLGTWYFIAASWDASGGTFLVRSAADTSPTVQTWGAATVPGWDFLRIGSNASSEWLNGSVCSFKAWRAKMTQAEMEAEMWQYMPARLDNLTFWYPLLTPETVDYSGLAQTLSGGSGATVDSDGPPIPWRQGRRARRRFIGVAVPEPDPGPAEAFPFTMTPAVGGWGGWL